MFKQNRLIYKKTPETKGAVPEKPEAPKVHAKNRQVLGDTIGASLKTPKKKPEEAFDYKTLLDKKLTPKQLEKLKEVRSTIPANSVLRLQENNPDIIAQLYCEPPDTSKEWTFNPHRNSSINRSIGLVNIYKNSFGVRNVKVTKPNGTEILGERSGLAGDFHTEQGHYLQILSGYKVEVKKTLPKNETQKLEKQFKEESKTYTASLEGNIPEKLEKQHGKDLAKKITETGLRQGVDPRYLLALLRQENGEKGYEFGIIGYSERAGFLNQLR
ncbi:MAG: hypothetical protein V1679_01770, partial [Candidatus Peregrinibacteria bacterium]